MILRKRSETNLSTMYDIEEPAGILTAVFSNLEAVLERPSRWSKQQHNTHKHRQYARNKSQITQLSQITRCRPSC
jgi:hypothetical protein